MTEMKHPVDTLIEHTLISSTEKPKAFIGKGKMRGYLLEEAIQNQFAIVSSERVYLNGVNHEFTGRSYKRRNVEAVVEIKDITSVSYAQHININYVISFFLAFLWFVLPTIVFPYVGLTETFFGTFDTFAKKLIFFAVYVAPMLVFFFLILNNKVHVLDIRHKGGNIGINVKYFGYNLVSNFRKKLFEQIDAKKLA